MCSQSLLRHSKIHSIVGDILEVDVDPVAGSQGTRPRLGDLALVHGAGAGEASTAALAQIVRLTGERVALQVFSGTKGLSTRASVSLLGHPPDVIFSRNIAGRVFDGLGRPVDGGPGLDLDRRVPASGVSVNPMRRRLASKMIRTGLPMIDLFNCLVESQKIPVFSAAGEPHNRLIARIGAQADADIIVFAGLGLIFDDFQGFRQAFEDAGVFPRTVMFVNQAADPIVERLLVPDMALAVAERFAVEENKRVLVLMTDMTAFADALKEVGIALERVPSNRGYLGDLYSQLARRYERAADYRDGGSVTILSVTTMPGDDVTHPVPDNTGYITEGQFYLRGGRIDPFGSLSRLKQYVIGKETREDHGQIMNTIIGLYADAQQAEQKQAMAFELSDYDRQLLRYGALFKARFTGIDTDLPLEAALDLCWATLAECFRAEQLVLKRDLIETYWPAAPARSGAG